MMHIILVKFTQYTFLQMVNNEAISFWGWIKGMYIVYP